MRKSFLKVSKDQLESQSQACMKAQTSTQRVIPNRFMGHCLFFSQMQHTDLMEGEFREPKLTEGFYLQIFASFSSLIIQILLLKKREFKMVLLGPRNCDLLRRSYMTVSFQNLIFCYYAGIPISDFETLPWDTTIQTLPSFFPVMRSFWVGAKAYFFRKKIFFNI